MTDKLFDDFFKQKLEHHDSGVPLHVWEKVRRQLHEDDDDRKVAWWRSSLWLIALILGGLTTAGIFYYFNKSSAKVDSFVATKNESGIINTQQNHTKPGENLSTESPSLLPTTSAVLNNQQSENKEITHTQPVNASFDNSNKNQASVSDAHAFQPDNTSAQHARIKNKPVSILTTQLATKEKADENQLTLASLQATNNLTFANGLPVKSVAKNQLFTENIVAPKIPSLNSSCPTIGPPRRNDLYIEFYGSPDNVTRNLTGTNGTPADYIDRRNEAEKRKVGFSAGVRIAKNLGERTLLKTGFNYSQINETLQYINAKDIRVVTVITQRTIISNGQTIMISDTTQVTQTGTTYTTYHNRYRTFDVPVIFSYELGNSRNLSVGLNAGAIFNIISSYNGKILDTNLTPVSINTANTLGVNAWRKNIGVGLYASISVYKSITDQMQLFFEPYARLNLKPVTANETLVKQKYSTTGLQLGIRYNLFPKRQRYIE
jgi:hypothetical protein